MATNNSHLMYSVSRVENLLGKNDDLAKKMSDNTKKIRKDLATVKKQISVSEKKVVVSDAQIRSLNGLDADAGRRDGGHSGRMPLLPPN